MIIAVPGTIVPQNRAQGTFILEHAQRRRFRWLSDSDILDDNVRRFLRAYTTPRSGSNGQLCWPLDEVTCDD